MEDYLSEIEYNRLSELLDIACSNLSDDELVRIKYTTTANLAAAVRDQIRDGRDLGIVLRRNAICDETNLHPLRRALKHLRRYDLLRIIYSHDRKTVKVDPLEEFLREEECKAKATKEKKADCAVPSGGKRKFGSASSECGADSEHVPDQNEETTRVTRKRCRTQTDRTSAGPSDEPPARSQTTNSSGSTSESSPLPSHSVPSFAGDCMVRSRYTCDVRLRVWAEYCDHERILNDNVVSNKADPLERQLERFSQASVILQSRDLGYIVCDIKFSEITYLDAFWRDYLNGSLLEALKGVFITESLKQAVGNEPIKLLVSIDEEDYEEGRNVLLGNVYMEAGREIEDGMLPL